MILDINPEFGIELTLAVPYANWLHGQGKLEKVITSKGMSPFYYFCGNVEERYDYRTIDNAAAGLNQLPNNWIYGFKENAKLYKLDWPDWHRFADVERSCGILDYRQWQMPDYKKQYCGDSRFLLDKPFIVICNRYNFEHGHEPLGYFDIECLYNMFDYLTSIGYAVIYKRPDNKEGFPLDQNEITTLNNQCTLTANVHGVGVIDDYQLTSYFNDVYLINEFVNRNRDLTYNEVQLKLFANADGFITIAGGGSTLFPCTFRMPTVSYFGREMQESLRDGFFFTNDNIKNIKNYHYMINPELNVSIDANGHDMLYNKYEKFLTLIKDTFNEDKLNSTYKK
jgi:hypothetical protein